MPELKARALMGSERGRKLIATLLAEIKGRYVVNIYDKLLALCGWFFEYIHEPAERHSDPYEHLAEMYYVAELAWVRGEFAPFQKKSGQD